MTDKRHVAGRLLDMSRSAVTTVRGGQHGDAESSFAAIGQMWTSYLNALSIRQTGLPLPGLMIMPKDVSFMMGHVKEIRVMYGDEQNADNYVDYAGYGSLAGMFHVPEANLPPASGEVAGRVKQPPIPVPFYEFVSVVPGNVVRVDRDVADGLPQMGEGEELPYIDGYIIKAGDTWPEGSWDVTHRLASPKDGPQRFLLKDRNAKTTFGDPAVIKAINEKEGHNKAGTPREKKGA